MPDITGQLTTALADRYRIESHLGEGGMATVYLAHDMKHNRKVALKVLRPELAAMIGAERFLQEIEVTANLQHPHILPLHDSGDADGFLFYVMPYVEGESLRVKLNREKQLSIENAIEIAKCVAAALDYAHRQGVIHRDIKPENILMHDGQALVADFGIALAVSQASGQRLTETGLSIGTPHYMSPEQAMGDRELDARSDVYSLGAMLYEMLAGDPPYQGSTAQAIVAKVITEKAPPVTTHRDTVPPHVAASVTKALSKLPADRFASAADFAEALTNTAFTLPTAAPAPAGAAEAEVKPLWSRFAWPAVAAVLLLTTIWALLPRSQPPRPIVRVSLALPAGEGIVPFIWGPTATFSPDGSQIVYMGPSESGAWQLWLRPLDRLRASPIPGTDGGYNWSFSPDGQAISFQEGQGLAKLKVVSLSGAPPLTLTDSSQWFGGDWGPDNWIYLTNALWGLSRIPASGGSMEAVTVVDTARGEGIHLWPDALPNGKGVVFTQGPAVAPNSQNYAIAVQDLGSGEHRTLLRGVYARYTLSGHLLYVTPDGALQAVAFNQDRLEVTGAPTPLLDGIGVKQFGAVDIAISATGTLLYSTGGVAGEPDQLVWVSRDGKEEVIDPDWSADFGSLALSPDGTRLAASIFAEGGEELWVKELERGPQSKLSFEGSLNYRPSWMSDGRTVMFVSDRAGQRDLWLKRADGSGRAELVQDNVREIDQGIFSPDGEWLVFRVGLGPRDIFGIRPGVDSVPQPLVAEEGHDEFGPALSPDGRWLAYVSDESGRNEVYVRPFPNTGEARWLVSTGGGNEPRWAHSGRELFYRNGAADFVAAEVRGTPTFGVGERKVLFSTRAYEGGGFHATYDVTADDQRFVMIRIAQSGSGASELIMVQNFFEELKAKVGN